jgi:hypothetical protein
MLDAGFWILDDEVFFYQKGISGSRLESEANAGRHFRKMKRGWENALIRYPASRI